MRDKTLDFLEHLAMYINTYLPYSVGASHNTIKSYKDAFRLLLEFLYDKKGISADLVTFDKLDYETLTEFLLWIENTRKCSVSTKNQRLSALSSFSAYAQNRDFDAASIFRNSVNKIPLKRTHHKQRAVFTRQEVTILLSLPNDRCETGLRDKVLLSLMYASGTRAQEICDLTVKNIYFISTGATLYIKGKGGKVRRIGIPLSCAAILKKYIEYRKIVEKPDHHIFSSQTHEQMTVSCIEEIYKKYVSKARLENPTLFLEKSYPPHSMRHSTASHMLESGVPLVVIKNFLGHASLQSTQIYAEISQSTMDKHLREWNEKWFPSNSTEETNVYKRNVIPDFLK